jgi:prephenate dehydrogenase
MRFALLGYGRFGRAFADLLHRAGHEVRVYDPRADVPPTFASASVEAAIADAEWVVLAMPVPHMAAALAQIQPLLDPAQTVIDVGSVKQHPCELLERELGTRIPHAGTHPLFGPLSIARGDALRAVLCASPHHPDAAARTRALFESLGCTVIARDPVAHDQAMAETHALAFYIAKALVEMGVGEDLSMAPPSFLGLANMLAAVRGDAGHLFAAIQQENPFADDARERFLAALTQIHQRLQRETDASGLAIAAPANRSC